MNYLKILEICKKNVIDVDNYPKGGNDVTLTKNKTNIFKRLYQDLQIGNINTRNCPLLRFEDIVFYCIK